MDPRSGGLSLSLRNAMFRVESADLQQLIPLTLERLRMMRATILAITRSHGASNVRVFGSVVTGRADLLSDLDIAVDMDSDRDLIDVTSLAADLEEALGWPVDLLVATDKDDPPRLAAFLSGAVPL
jgi:predicted nucleotidyltransferase